MVVFKTDGKGVVMKMSTKDWHDAVRYMLTTATYAYPVPIPDYGEW